jgi:hypothetical protein
MTNLPKTWNRRGPALAAGLVLVLLAGLAAWAVEPDPGSRTEADAGNAFRSAVEINRALQQLQAALQGEREKADAAPVQPPKRPARVVEPPTLDPAGLDALFDRFHETSRTQAAPLVDDEAFARRVWLDVTGKLPTPGQIEDFCQSRAPDKRARLIDQLLESPDYARNWARYWRDVIQFRATNTNPIQVRFVMLEDWLNEQLAANTPWDEVATSLITAAGRNDRSAPANFVMAQMGQPAEMAGEVARIFMGVQIQCAQCHDHPTDPWKRRQFHEFAAFFGGLKQPRQVIPPAVAKAQGVLPAFEIAVQRGPVRYTMSDPKDPQNQIPVQPRFFLAASASEEPVPAGLTSDQCRALAASYVTGQDNPWFARAFVNRIWYALIGTGFYNPVDDMGPARIDTAVAPEILDVLATQWQQGGHDVRWLFRTILNTRTYQREARTLSSSSQALFAANCPVRLRSDQVLDALAQALDVPLGNPPFGMGMGMGQGGAGGLAAMYRQRLFNPRMQFNAIFGVDPSTPHEDILGTIPQALFLMNSPQLNQAINGSSRRTVLGKILADNAGDHDALTALYLRVLARRPNPQEVDVCDAYLARVGNRTEAFEDILWNLVNSTEFLSRR